MSGTTTTISPEDLDLSALLTAVSCELSAIAGDAKDIEALLMAAVSGAPNPALIRRAQALDLLVQRMEALAAVLVAVTAHIPASRVPADSVLDGVKLSHLARRLAGLSERASGPAEEFW